MTGQGGGQGADPSGILGEFAEFLAARERAAREREGADVDVPLFEKLADGAERSATLPMRLARPLLESWGWLIPEGSDDGGESGESGGTEQGGGARSFFQQIAGGGQPASGPRTASGQRAPRKAAG